MLIDTRATIEAHHVFSNSTPQPGELNAFTTGNPLRGANLLELSIGKDFGVLKGSRSLSPKNRFVQRKMKLLQYRIQNAMA